MFRASCSAFRPRNRLTKLTGIQDYRYDGLGRRVQTTDADGKYTFWQYSQKGQVMFASEARKSRNTAYIYLGNTQIAARHVAWGTRRATPIIAMANKKRQHRMMGACAP